MKRNAGAQGSEGKLESRFAALTSGLLARKGQAAPSNSPIHDPAEETDAFALEPTHKKKTAIDLVKTPAPKAPPAETKPAAKTPQADAPPPAKKLEAPAKEPAKPAPAAEIRLKEADRVPPAQMTVINERSYEAGYPDNPSPEEIAALEAEADEVVSYFENFGSEDALALEKDDFYGDDDVIDELEEAADDAGEIAPPAAPLAEIAAEAAAGIDADIAAAGPWAGASVPPVAASAAYGVTAGVTVQLTAREFMRLSLGAAELEQSAQALIAEAIEEYLDARGVLSLGGCSCLEALTKKPG
ncbi:MAG: hypothetical protein A3E78_11065 [Alphaproteobacteria bacterium RIFCSPHIGHO2_12_FULL_63_12]|nr:MAG: hypothetical protein A3E78_11065 [Alphaproteobacteria bacterium RIFCSPHIGHO2_12_FULL_63_12]